MKTMSKAENDNCLAFVFLSLRQNDVSHVKDNGKHAAIVFDGFLQLLAYKIHQTLTVKVYSDEICHWLRNRAFSRDVTAAMLVSS